MKNVPKKNRQCPLRKNCLDYGGCATCDIGKEIYRLHSIINRLKGKQTKGQWMRQGNDVVCSKCGVHFPDADVYKWCSFCGQKNGEVPPREGKEDAK